MASVFFVGIFLMRKAAEVEEDMVGYAERANAT
jgi:hypothetical protein